MTPVGHILTGTAIAVLCLPARASTPHKLVHFAAFMGLANLPDLPFEIWGHQRYDLSHSLLVNLLFIAVALLGLAMVGGLAVGPWPWVER
jgi:hypothetical protein